MASNYPVQTGTVGHRIVQARAHHDCFGVPHRVKNFWVMATSPICTGAISYSDYHLEFDNPLTRLQAKACLACVLHYGFSDLHGELAQYKPLTEEALEQARVDLEADVAELIEDDDENWLVRQVRLATEEVGRVQSLLTFCPDCGISFQDPQPKGIGFLTDEYCRSCRRYTLE